jgi:NADH-quinone oxidoreductase subunit L
MAIHGMMTLPFWLAVSGVALAYYMYMVNTRLPVAIKGMFEPVYKVLENKYYFDWFNENVLARGARALGLSLWQSGDRFLIDGAVVNGSWKVVGLVSTIIRKAQTGFLHHYALVMMLGVFVILSYFVTWPMLVQWLGR